MSAACSSCVRRLRMLLPKIRDDEEEEEEEKEEEEEEEGREGDVFSASLTL